MDRINKILTHPKYIHYLKMNEEAEINRKFCHHHLQHSMDVSRVAYILSLEENLSIKKEIIYATGLLHDIGRFKQYEENIDHALIGAEFAVEILQDSGFNKDEVELITQAIKNHRKNTNPKTDLDRIIYISDKNSRLCNACPALDECNRFSKEKKPFLYY